MSNEQINIWAHSNGGQIALSVLEISQKNYPTTLWAPVTVGFPKSVFYYMDDYEKMDELGKEVYNTINNCCQNYACNKLSIDNYWKQIQAPIQVHQGLSDPLIPQSWSDNCVRELERLNKDITYHTYPNSDHNLKQDWDEVVEKDLDFFNTYNNKN